MEKIEVTQIEAYSWKCPNCGVMHVTDKYSDLICDNCCEKYEIGHVNK